MLQQYLPDIGATGNYYLKAPYDTLVKAGVSYTCKAIRKLSSFIAEGQDPFSFYYESVGLDETTFQADVDAGVSIVSLQTDGGEWLHIPSNYITRFPNMNGIVYRAMMLGVSLGAIPDTMNLEALKTSVNNLVYDTLGITPVIKEVVISVPSIVSKTDHDLIEQARIAKTKIKMSDTGLLAKANQDLATARAKIVELENYIKTKL